KLADDLKRSNKDLENFAYVASHDLNEPLRMITSYLRLIEKRYGERLDQDGKEFIHFAMDGSQRLKALIDSLLNYSHAGSAKLELLPTDCTEILETVRQNLKLRLEETGAEL